MGFFTRSRCEISLVSVLFLLSCLCLPWITHAKLLQYGFGFADDSCSSANEAFLIPTDRCVVNPGQEDDGSTIYSKFYIENNQFSEYSFNDSACTVSRCPLESNVGACDEDEEIPLGVCVESDDNDCGDACYVQIGSYSTSLAAPITGSSAVANPLTFFFFAEDNFDCTGDPIWSYTVKGDACDNHFEYLFTCDAQQNIISASEDCDESNAIEYTPGACSTDIFLDSYPLGSLIAVCGTYWKPLTAITQQTKTTTVATVATTVAAATATSVATSVAVAVIAPGLTSSVGASVSSSAAAPAAGGNLMGMIASVQTLALVGGLAAAPASFSEMTSSLDWMNVRFSLPFSSSKPKSNGRRLTSSEDESLDMDKIIGTWFWAAVTLVTVTVLRLCIERYFRKREGVIKYESIAMEEGNKAKKKRFNWRAALSGLLLFPRWEGPAVLFLLPGVGQSIGEAISSTDDWLIIVGTVVLIIYPIAFLVFVGHYLHTNIYTSPAVKFIPHDKPFTLKGFITRDKEVIETGEWEDVSGKKFKKRFGFLFGKQTYQRFGFLYNVLETVRVLLVAVLCGALRNSDGLSQSAVLFGLSALSFLYCAIVRPFNDRVENLVQSVTVLSQAAIFGVTLLQSIGTVSPSFSESVLVPIGFSGIGTHILNQVMTSVLTVLSVFNRLKLHSAGVTGMIGAPSQMASVAKVVASKGLKQDEESANQNTKDSEYATVQSTYLTIDSRMTQLRIQFVECALQHMLSLTSTQRFSDMNAIESQLYAESISEFARNFDRSRDFTMNPTVLLATLLRKELLKTVENEAAKSKQHVLSVADRYVDKILTDLDHVWGSLHKKLLRTCQLADSLLSQTSKAPHSSDNSVPVACVAVSLANQLLTELRLTLSKSKQNIPAVESRLFSTLCSMVSGGDKELSLLISSTETIVNQLWKTAGSLPESEVVQACNRQLIAGSLSSSSQLSRGVIEAFLQLASLSLSKDFTPRQQSINPSDPSDPEIQSSANSTISQLLLDIFTRNVQTRSSQMPLGPSHM